MDSTDPVRSRARDSGRGRNLIALAAIGAVVAAALAFSRLGGADKTATEPSSGGSSLFAGAAARDSLAMDVLRLQEQALVRADEAGYLSTWDPQAASAMRQGRTTYTNLQALHAAHVRTRYVAADVSGLSLAERRRIGSTAWTAEVEVEWRLAGFDQTDARTTLSYTFVQRGDVARVVQISSAAGSRAPIWMLGDLDVRRTSRTLAATASPGGADRLSRQLQTAIDDVERVIPSWDGKLVAYEPAGERRLAALLSSESGTYSGIAAVTTTVDGSREQGSPVAIVLNPDEFDKLGRVGAHVVITHESTHVATQAAAIDLPLWVAEGFADYVGVGSVDVPLRVSAGAAMRYVDEHGPPATLPTDQDFASGSPQLQANYELAWLAMRMMAEQYGQPEMVDFYRRVVRSSGHLPQAFQTLGTTRREFTKDWQDYLEDLARAH